MAGKPKTIVRTFFILAAASAMLLSAVGAFAAPENAKDSEKDPPKKNAGPAPSAAEIRFVDGSTMKLLLRETKIELETDYGKLLIPVADIQRIEFGLRIPDEARKKIHAAIAGLASTDFRRRQAASADLLALREKAYPALLRAAEGKDVEASRRAQEIADRIRETLTPDESLEMPTYDVVHTAKSKIAGLIKGDSLRVTTVPFGDQQAKLADMRSLQSQGAPRTDDPATAAVILPDPGSPRMFANQAGKTLLFRVTGPQPGMAGQMGVFGNDVYTLDSSLAGAAVHAGVVRPGQTTVIRVTFVGQHPAFPAVLRNGVMSNNWGPWEGFRIEQPRPAPR